MVSDSGLPEERHVWQEEFVTLGTNFGHGIGEVRRVLGEQAPPTARVRTLEQERVAADITAAANMGCLYLHEEACVWLAASSRTDLRSIRQQGLVGSVQLLDAVVKQITTAEDWPRYLNDFLLKDNSLCAGEEWEAWRCWH